jgi:acetyl/propionyl-CoA carboxylase alpha subunit
MYKAKIGEKETVVDFNNSSYTQGVVNDVPFELDINVDEGGRFHIIRNHKSFNAELVTANYDEKSFTIKVNGAKYNVAVKDRFDELLSKMGMESMGAKKLKDFKAPMPGLVIDINVESGQEVVKGDSLLVLEAMKMENILKSPADGVIGKIEITKGQAVEKNQILIHFV